MESSGFRLMTNAKPVLPIPIADGHWGKRPGKWLEERESDANSRHETVSPSASTERGQPPPPDRAAERGSAPQTDPHLCPRWLWENHVGQPMACRLPATGSLAVAGRRG